MRKGNIKRLMAAVLILCTLLSANICPNVFASAISSGFSKSEAAEAQDESGPDFGDGSDVVTGGKAAAAQNTKISGMGTGYFDDEAAVQSLRGMSGGLEYAAFRRVERVKRSVSWSFSAVLFKTAVFFVLVLFLALAVGGREQNVQMTILSFIHNKDGKKEKTALLT